MIICSYTYKTSLKITRDSLLANYGINYGGYLVNYFKFSLDKFLQQIFRYMINYKYISELLMRNLIVLAVDERTLIAFGSKTEQVNGLSLMCSPR